MTPILAIEYALTADMDGWSFPPPGDRGAWQVVCRLPGATGWRCLRLIDEQPTLDDDRRAATGATPTTEKVNDNPAARAFPVAMVGDDEVQRRDRADAVATAILQVVRETLTAWLHRYPADMAAMRAEVAAILRDEFDDVARQVLHDIRPTD